MTSEGRGLRLVSDELYYVTGPQKTLPTPTPPIKGTVITLRLCTDSSVINLNARRSTAMIPTHYPFTLETGCFLVKNNI